MRYLFFALLIFLHACSANRTNRIKPPIADADIPFTIHRFDADKGTLYRTATGTELQIEPGSFMNAKGEIVKGTIELRVREFHSAGDILRAGIPMDLSAGNNSSLQSAGMLEVRAFSKKEELQVAKGKSLGVSLATYRNSDGYQLYHLEDNDRWNVTGEAKRDSNRVKIESIRINQDSLQKPESPTERNPRDFELVGSLSEIPYLKPYAGITWRLDESEPLSVLGIEDRIHWEDVRIRAVNRKKQLYALSFVQFDREELANRGIQKTILARPLASKKDMKQLEKKYEAEIAKWEEQEKERKERLARAKREADLVRTFRMDRLGIWNIDRLMNMENCTPVHVHFDFEKSFSPNDHSIRLFALYDGENSVKEYSPEEWKTVYLQKGAPMRLISLLPNDQVALVENENIQSVLAEGKTDVLFQTKLFSSKDFMKTILR